MCATTPCYSVSMSVINLNEAQKKAVLATEGPVLILAGAGAGKTKVIVERIKNLVKKGVAPSSILAITFTNKAAKEMRERIEKGLEEDKDINRPISITERPFVSTFHSLGVHILREQSGLLGLNKRFAILDRDDSKRAIKEALLNKGLDPKTHEPGKILSIISKEKGRGVTANDYAKSSEWRGYSGEIVGSVWPEYEKILKRDGALDFDDLLLKTERLLREHSGVREYYQNIWKYIHIDEYQDTNRVQYEISKMLVGKENNICAVGDIDQNIYSWRGAELKNILAFEKDYPQTLVVTLEENYRSTKTILGVANAVIEKNNVRRPKNLYTSNEEGDKISVVGLMDEMGEADFVAKECEKMVHQGISPDEIAVLYRANFQSRILEEAFMHRGVPYQVLGTRFFERKEVKDLLAYLRAGINKEGLGDVKRIINVPARGLGKVTITKLFSGEKESLPLATKIKIDNFYSLLNSIGEMAQAKRLSEIISFIIKNSGLEEEWKKEGEEGASRLENAYELVSFSTRYDNLPNDLALDQFLADTALQSDQDELKEEVPAVRLMTVHAAKGLEFKTVFVTGLESGLFPHEKMHDERLSPEESEEERRLFYVAVTRARKKLYLTYAQLRTIFGRSEINMPSEFLMDIPSELVEEEKWSNVGTSGRRPLLDIDF